MASTHLEDADGNELPEIGMTMKQFEELSANIAELEASHERLRVALESAIELANRLENQTDDEIDVIIDCRKALAAIPEAK